MDKIQVNGIFSDRLGKVTITKKMFEDNFYMIMYAHLVFKSTGVEDDVDVMWDKLTKG